VQARKGNAAHYRALNMQGHDAKKLAGKVVSLAGATEFINANATRQVWAG
jgi:hypothetical protein